MCIFNLFLLDKLGQIDSFNNGSIALCGTVSKDSFHKGNSRFICSVKISIISMQPRSGNNSSNKNLSLQEKSWVVGPLLATIKID